MKKIYTARFNRQRYARSTIFMQNSAHKFRKNSIKPIRYCHTVNLSPPQPKKKLQRPFQLDNSDHLFRLPRTIIRFRNFQNNLGLLGIYLLSTPPLCLFPSFGSIWAIIQGPEAFLSFSLSLFLFLAPPHRCHTRLGARPLDISQRRINCLCAVCGHPLFSILFCLLVLYCRLCSAVFC